MENVFKNLPVFETSKLILRKLRYEDISDLYEHRSDTEVAKYLLWERHTQLKDTEDYINKVLDKYKSNQIALWGIELKENKKLIGTIDFVWINFNHKSGEIGASIAKEYWGQGICTEAIMEVMNYGFNYLNLNRIQGRCFSENIGGQKLVEKLGMKLEGVAREALILDGISRDIKIYAILKDEFNVLNKKLSLTNIQN